jgi:hypothetical protein
MLVSYCITDKQGVDFGALTYNPETKVWHLEINPARTWEDTPFSLAVYVKHGIYSLGAEQSLAWVRDRLVPPNRQNIQYILRELELDEYDEFALIQKTRGASPNDGMFLVPNGDTFC